MHGPKLLERIVMDPLILAGKPVVRGTRVPGELVVRHLADTGSIEDVLAAFPRLTIEDVRASLAYAAQNPTGIRG
jgi:uncharacterized protein (DUF433 family)